MILHKVVSNRILPIGHCLVWDRGCSPKPVARTYEKAHGTLQRTGATYEYGMLS